ncbi:hypothetical protein AB0D08_34225 [Kitasatospora sp. NPDC048540]|uniref:hypothetical protein n=1 Tax=unclassified Kitasatospora TaxID=2633591 RepID=UPI00053A3F15|nr:hypothetical protein [Kitasatospora sp. MBT63]
MPDEATAHRLVDAFFTHCHHCGEPEDPDCHDRSLWRLYLDLSPATVERLRLWIDGAAVHHSTPGERAALLRWLDALAA